MLDVFEADDRRTLVEAISQLQAEGGVLPSFCRCCVASGGRWLRVCGFPGARAGRELSRIVGFLEDITEHKLAEDALRDSEAKLRTLFNHSPDLIFTVDGEAKSCSPTGPAVSGRRRRREAIGTDSAAGGSRRDTCRGCGRFSRADASSISSTTVE
jgi:PAS domain-containing protein